MSRAKTEIRDFPVYTNEDFILESNTSPLYVLADRFKCFRLRVRKNHTEDERVIAYLVKGDKANEKVLIYLTFDHHYDLITNVRIHRRTDFDPQLGRFLGLALVFRLKNDAIFTFAHNAIPVSIK